MSEFTLNGELWETERDIPALGVRLKIYIMQENESGPTPRQIEVLKSLTRLREELRNEIAGHARAFCNRVDAVVNLAGEGMVIDSSDVSKHYRLQSILIPEIGECESNLMFISSDCDWEPEHGMQILIENGRVVCCSEHNGLAFSALWKKIISAPNEIRGTLLLMR